MSATDQVQSNQSAADDIDFDETWYLQKYPDVAAAVARRGWKSGYEHYCKVGRDRGRLGSPGQEAAKKGATTQARPPGIEEIAEPAERFDPDYYRQSYPLAAAEVARGIARDLHEHFRRIGRHRGYLPNRTAPRPPNPAAWRSRFGGFWTDQANALDLLEARLDLHLVAERHAAPLRAYIDDGYAILENAIPPNVLDRAEDVLDRAYAGEMPDVLFNITGLGRKTAWQPDVLTKPTKALDLHWLSADIRDLILSSRVLDFLHSILERRAFATQTLSFWRGSAQDAHQDSAYVNYSHPMQFLATWIALEDVSEHCGELFYFVGSQRLPEYLYMGQYKGVEEAARINPGASLETQIKDHIIRLPTMAAAHGLERKRFLAKRGDVLVWSADLAHGGSPISTDKSRKSIVTHYCTAEAVPSYFENRPDRTIQRHRGGYYSSAHYDFASIP